MCDFQNLNDEEKAKLHHLLLTCANNYGGINFFLQLIESLREQNTHPLTSRHQDYLFEFGNIKWGKTIFNDKIELIAQRRKEKESYNNFLPEEGTKQYKRILNMIKTLKPIIFSVRPALRDNGEGFDFPAFDIIDEKRVLLNPIFDALFFSSSEQVKKVLNYKV